MSGGFVISKKSFYFFPVTNIIGADEGHGLAAILCACGSSDAMDIILGVVGDVVVDDERYVRHIDTAGDDVGGDEDGYLAVPKIEHDLVALMLLQIGVHGVRVDMKGTQHAREIFYSLFFSCENYYFL